MSFLFGKQKKATPINQGPFSDWPGFTFLPVAEGFALFNQNALSSEPAAARSGFEFGPTLVIGLGLTGEAALHDWLEDVSDSSLGREKLHAIHFSTATNKPFDAIPGGPAVRVFPLTKEHTGQYQAQTINREFWAKQFNQAAVYQPAKEYLITCAEQLRADIKVFIIGSVSDPAIGILGNLLQLLGLLQSDNHRYFHTVNAVLAVDINRSPGSLAQADIHAALREIGRFTFKGIHVMSPAIGEKHGTLDSNLLDHIFLIETPHNLNEQNLDIDSADLTAQALSEAVYVLGHPSSQVIWERIKNIAPIASQIRKDQSFPVVHGFGVATQLIPVQKLLDYASLQMTQDVLFGEQGAEPKGMFTPTVPAESGEHIAKRWVASQTYGHPIFKWLISIGASTDLDQIPEISPDLAQVFSIKIAAQANQDFVDAQFENRLASILEAVEWLQAQIARTGRFADQRSQAKSPPKNLTELVGQMKQIQHALDSFAKSIRDWIEAGSIASTPVAQEAKLAKKEAEGNPFEKFLANQQDSAKDHPSANTSGGDSSWPGLQSSLKQKLSNARDALLNEHRSPVRHSLINPTGREEDLGQFYVDVIRPEMVSGQGTSRYYRRIRQRLGWWVHFVPEKYELKLLAICLPPGWGKGDDLYGTYFYPDQHAAYFEQVWSLIRHVLDSARNQITATWFDRQLEREKTFFQAFRSNHLTYDRDQVVRLKEENIATNIGYLIGRDPVQTENATRLAFSEYPPSKRVVLSGNDPYRLSAFAISFCIPLIFTNPYLQTYHEYRYKSVVHLYAQERNAKLYDKKIRELDWESEVIPISAPIAMTLAEESLVKVFFRALFSGLITIDEAQVGYEKTNHWVVNAVNGFDAILLCRSQSQRDLITAYETFTLELPNAPSEKITRRDPLSQENRNTYLRTLILEINQSSQLETYRELCGKKYSDILKGFQKLSRQDAMIRDFVHILQIEYDGLWETLTLA